jgi:hypothetical protein
MPNNKFTPRPSEIPRLPEEEVQTILIDMYLNEKQSPLDLVNWLRFTSGYNYGKTFAYQLVKEAVDEVANVWKETARNTVENAQSTLYKQLADAQKRGDHRLAFDIQKEINKITQLYKGNDDDGEAPTFIIKWGK